MQSVWRDKSVVEKKTLLAKRKKDFGGYEPNRCDYHCGTAVIVTAHGAKDYGLN